MTMVFVLGGLAAVVIAALRTWAALRHALVKNLVHQIAELLDTIDADSQVDRPAADASLRTSSGYSTPAVRSALLGSRLAGAVEAFLGQAAELARAGLPSSASRSSRNDEPGVVEAQRRRVEDLGQVTLRALRDVLSGRRHDVITRA